MSAGEKKEFVIEHVFEDVLNMKQVDDIAGNVEYHHNIPWNIQICRNSNFFAIALRCSLGQRSLEWSINTKISPSTSSIFGRRIEGKYQFEYSENYSEWCKIVKWADIQEYLVHGSLTVTLLVEIDKTRGVEAKKLRNFDEKSMKKYSDVVLVVGNEEFYVNKMHLASHSTYFDSLLLGNFSESEKSIIELKDVDPRDFQCFLELINGESPLDDYIVIDILKLSDFFDSETAIRRCEEFLLEKSKKSLKEKFHAAIKYNMNALKEKCISNMKSAQDFLSILPENAHDFDADLWKELFLKSHKSH
ncbi:hypothetical protein B9Z55_027182 [Caenorhabditis nigoni]|uniref:BTB domain-containing protein n=1 Tax=Caenorhabditis nigoni TaxID=1611254 RepID=A0A2G5SGZ6_9PELO|nr:hypothetical protein B9Z55_027182 [Caenorhabditis nigoni]